MADPDTLQAIARQIDAGQYDEAAGACLSILRQNPKDVPVIALYGKLALQMGRTEDAIIILRKLLGLAPDHTGAHEALALAFRTAGDYRNARVHALRALELNADSVESRLVLAGILVSEGSDEEALRYMEEARELTYGDPRVEKIYIDGLLNTGRFSTAQELLRELVALYPEDGYLEAQLPQPHRFTAEDPDLQLVRSLADANGDVVLDVDPEDKVDAYMALFKVESDLENTSLAFDYLKKAKAIKKTVLPPYRSEEFAGRQDQMHRVFDARLLHAIGAAGCPSKAPIFIVGMPRSGTSILERVLASHPDVAAGGEMPTVGRLMDEACVAFGSNQYDLPALGSMPKDAWRQLGEKYIQLARERTGQAQFFTDKMPDNVFQVGFIRAMLPNATIIHISRHPVANCLSIYEQDFAEITYGNDLSWLGARYLDYRKAIDHWRGVLPGGMVEIEYESLVTDTAGVLGSLGPSLGLEFDAGNIEASQQTGEILTASRWQARQPIHTGSVDRWKLLEEELQPLIGALAPILQEA